MPDDRVKPFQSGVLPSADWSLVLKQKSINKKLILYKCFIKSWLRNACRNLKEMADSVNPISAPMDIMSIGPDHPGEHKPKTRVLPSFSTMSYLKKPHLASI
jgi:hypothetical protein